MILEKELSISAVGRLFFAKRLSV